MKPGFRIAVDVHQHSGKYGGIGVCYMPCCLAIATDQTIEIFHRPGNPFQGVGFHFTEVDDGIRLCHFFCKIKFLRRDSIGECHFHFLRHGGLAGAVDGFFFFHSQLSCGGGTAAVSRRVAVEHLGTACLLQKAEHSLHHGRVGGGCCLRGTCQHEVGFHQDFFLRIHKFPDAAQSIHSAFYCPVYRFFFICITRNENDFRLLFLLLFFHKFLQ